ncbi:2OG-Fe dioxygenase family protein [Streptomyces sp. ADMS]|uniref:2OG-Fe dioxygenase family protein n=1 Tax=Streptomyces sp. ADMS TaxID=3071415 RepID=UPI00296F749E|nr:2OG-Fe dioxygenase family protein [Streptomyces sp. ADMS]MDW4911315.1 2OG-Fe dioxygenase family protein [Streptomyces sp. ADMS]
MREPVMDGRFDVLLAKMQVGTADAVKTEIAASFWDEMGNGDHAQVHAHLFNVPSPAASCGGATPRPSTWTRYAVRTRLTPTHPPTTQGGEAMPLGSQGFAVIQLPETSPDILPSYDDCPVDEFMGNGTRFKRFSQYRLSPAGSDGWSFERLPHRDYTTFKKFDSAGCGIRRIDEPIKVDFTPLIEVGARELGLDRSEDWQINVHQNRTRADGGGPGPLTPAGVHHDGHEFVMIAILNKLNVAGGTTRLWTPDADDPLWTDTLEPGQAVLWDDRALAHDVTAVLSADGGRGHRDILIVAFSRWAEKWYGDDHYAAALTEQ